MTFWKAAPLLVYACVLSRAEPAQRFVGTIEDVKANTAEIVIRPDQGEARPVKVSAETVLQRIAPGEKTLKNAVPISIQDVARGDRVLVTLNPGGSELQRLVVMSAADIEKRQETDREDWRKRGLSGIVSARSAAKITLKTRSPAAETQIQLNTTPATVFRRYAPDSIRFADAKLSSLADLNLGDQVCVRGAKNADGSFQADEIVFGSFVTKAGKIASVDAAAQTVTVRELQTSRLITIQISAATVLKAMPNFAAFGQGGGNAPASFPQGPPSGSGPPDIGQMLERMPSAAFTDLQPGDTVVLSSTASSSDRFTAIMLLNKADALIQMASMQRSMQGASAGLGIGGAGMSTGASGLEGLQLPGIVP